MTTEAVSNALADLADWSLPELVDAARLLTGELAERVADPGLVDHLPRFPKNPPLHPADEWGLYSDDVRWDDLDGVSLDEIYAQTPVEEPAPRGTLPELHAEVEALGRSVDAARTALAGHTARIFDQHQLRDQTLGIPEGKCAYRSAVEYLRDQLRIPRRQAKSRIERSRHLMATTSLDHSETEPARLPELARVASKAEMDPAALDSIIATLTGAREAAAETQLAPGAVDALLAEGEQSLVSSARDLDPDALGRVCAHWRLRFDAVVAPDGPEPADARRAGQGLFYRGRRDGLHRWSLVAADGQHEVLKTITAAASDIRAGKRASEHTDERTVERGDERGDERSGDLSDRSHSGTGEATPPAGEATPRAGKATPRAGKATPRAGEATPRVDEGAPPADEHTPDADDEARGTSVGAEPDEGVDAGAATGAGSEADLEAEMEARLEESPESELEDDPEGELEADRPGGFQEIHSLYTLETSVDPGLRWERQANAAQAVEDEAAADRAAVRAAAMAGEAAGWNTSTEEPDTLDGRSKAQRELDGLISALTGALALTTGDGAADGGGGTRPQVLVTIDYQSLLEHAHRPPPESPGSEPGSGARSRSSSEPDSGSSSEPGSGDGSEPDSGAGPHVEPVRGSRISAASYSGEIGPTTIRAWACDAELIPVVLGGEGEVLDVGRSRRLFTRKLRRALTARDGGCAAPGCTIPAPWCEAHHIEHWEHGGPTSVDNGVLLCSHHHHVVHAGGWTISVRNGIPWFIPAAYHDPLRTPRRNQLWRPRAAE